jgi:hypothetical protein
LQHDAKFARPRAAFTTAIDAVPQSVFAPA